MHKESSSFAWKKLNLFIHSSCHIILIPNIQLISVAIHKSKHNSWKWCYCNHKVHPKYFISAWISRTFMILWLYSLRVPRFISCKFPKQIKVDTTEHLENLRQVYHLFYRLIYIQQKFIHHQNVTQSQEKGTNSILHSNPTVQLKCTQTVAYGYFIFLCLCVTFLIWACFSSYWWRNKPQERNEEKWKQNLK